MNLEAITFFQIEVADVERSARWYRRMLGLQPVRGGAGAGLDLKGGACRFRLVAGRPARARGFRFGMELASRPEVRAWRAGLDHNGALPAPICERDGSYGFSVVDPDGYVLEFRTTAPEGESG